MKRIAILTRLPVPGEVKSRLSPAVPPDLAARLYAAMLTDTLEVAAAAGADSVEVWWASAPEGAPPVPLPDGFSTRVQRGTDLGERLEGAFAELLADGVSRALLIGADCPDLDAAMLREGLASLDDHDVVLGPADDGGYYLIGLRRAAPTLFSGIPWGTGDVRSETLARARRAGLTVRTLGALADVDTPDDLVRLVARWSVAAPGPGRRTEAALREMGLLPARG